MQREAARWLDSGERGKNDRGIGDSLRSGRTLAVRGWLSWVLRARICAVSEGKRMASGHTGNVVPRKGLRVRVPCPPLFDGNELRHSSAECLARFLDRV